jgi:hypothetical protein
MKNAALRGVFVGALCTGSAGLCPAVGLQKESRTNCILDINSPFSVSFLTNLQFHLYADSPTIARTFYGDS